MIVDRSLENDLLHLVEIVLQRSLISIRDFVGLDEQCGVPFHVDESDWPTEREIDLLWVEQMKCCDVMLAKT
jgi:hypothetical protein